MSSTFYKESDDIMERFELATERISQIKDDKELPENLQAYFNKVAEFVMSVLPIMNKAIDGTLAERSLEQCQTDNKTIFSIYDTVIIRM